MIFLFLPLNSFNMNLNHINLLTKSRKMKIKLISGVTLLFVFSLATISLNAQTLDDVVSKYNAAAEFVNSDAIKAAGLLEEAVELANKVGAEADELRIMAESQLPAVYFKIAGQHQKDGDTDAAIEAFHKSFDLGLEYNDPHTVSRSQANLGRLYLMQGNNAYRGGENEKAIEYLKNSVKFDPENAKTFLLMGLAYRKLENLEEMTTAMDQSIVLAQNASDNQTKATAEKSMRDYLAVRANKSIQANKGAEAVELMQLALKYGEEAQTYFLLTLAYNNLKQWDNALEAAGKALALENDTPTDKAKIYFEMGNAYREKGNTAEACKAFKSAAHGNYAESANYQIQHVLKCQ